MGWWALSNYMDDWTMIRCYLLGSMIGYGFTVHNNQKGIGASSGILAIKTYVAFHQTYHRFYWSPTLITNNITTMPLLIIIIIGLSLDYMAELWRRQYPSNHYLANVNLIRYGLNNVSFWGHFGGFIAGLLITFWLVNPLNIPIMLKNGLFGIKY
jgi:membrane associated rhomboid family serine protease